MELRPLYYDKQCKPIDVKEWARLWEDWSYRCIADERIGDVRVATVWEGIDHIFYGALYLFESMVFGGKLDKESARYETLEEAQRGHQVLVERVRALQVEAS
jgi:hypothetical protein